MGYSDGHAMRLNSSAAEFKGTYECLYEKKFIYDAWIEGCYPVSVFIKNNFVGIDTRKDLSQNPGKDVKRARVNTVDGSLPAFTTSSTCLPLCLS